MKKTLTRILFIVFVLCFSYYSNFSVSYQWTSKDKDFVDILVKKVIELEQKKPWITNKLIKILPLAKQKYEKKWDEKISYLLWRLYFRLTGLDIVDNTNIDNKKTNWNVSDFDFVYEVWPWKKYSDLNEIQWENLKAWSIILIYYREQAYKNKFVINVAWTEKKPVVILWVKNKNWDLPKIDWNLATTRRQLDYRNEERSLIKIWWSSKPDESIKPSWIYIENLEIYWAKQWNMFFNDNWNEKKYSNNATCIHIEYWNHIFLRKNLIHNCSNWIFTTHFTDNVFIQWNKIWNNWNIDDWYCHNTYTESKNIVYEFNFMWDLFVWSKWTNLKDRSAWTIIRYNWIEWWNRQIDLVETTHQELKKTTQYNKTFVYWNLLMEKKDEWNQQIMHYWWDGWDKSMYRDWILYFYNNTVISFRKKYTTLINLSLNTAKMFIYNNIFYTSAWQKNFALTDWRWQVFLKNNILPLNWKKTHNSVFYWNIVSENNIQSNNLWFIDIYKNNFNLLNSSVWYWKSKDFNLEKKVLFKYDNMNLYKKRNSLDLWAF